MALKWGIISTGRISNDFVTCLNNLPKSEHQIVAVAARSLENARKFANEHNIPKAYGSYEELCQDPDIEVGYVANLTRDHFWISKMLLENRKHVLCEKAMCKNLNETEQLITMARKQKVFLMEAIWSRCFPIYHHLKNELAAETIGTPNLVNVTFAANGKTGKHNLDRTLKQSFGGSAMLDIGVYPVQLVSLIYGGEKPHKIIASGYLNEEGVDEVAAVTLHYSKERIANLIISMRSVGCNNAIISGSKGFIKINHPFHCPTEMETPGKTYKEKLPQINGKIVWDGCEGLTYEAQHVRECIRKGLLESPLLSLDESRVLSFILTEIRKQLQAVDI